MNYGKTSFQTKEEMSKGVAHRIKPQNTTHIEVNKARLRNAGVTLVPPDSQHSQPGVALAVKHGRLASADGIGRALIVPGSGTSSGIVITQAHGE